MPDYLSAEWIDAMASAANSAPVGEASGDLVIQYVVTAATGEVAWAVQVHDGKVNVETGLDPAPAITFTLDAATAAAIHSGQQSAQAAFMSGRLRLDGEVGLLVAEQSTLAALDDIFASVRAATTYPAGGASPGGATPGAGAAEPTGVEASDA